jgi:aldehyde dehydrogenase (NAD+)
MVAFVDVIAEILSELGVAPDLYQGGTLDVRSPITGQRIGRVQSSTMDAAQAAIRAAHAAFLEWRVMPPPKRGELVRLFGEELRAAVWSPSNPAKSFPKARAKCRR